MTYQPASTVEIGGKKIGRNHPVYFIAEIGSNFDRSLSRAQDLIYMAKEAGADAAKFQHYTADSLVSDVGFKNMGGRSSHQAKWKKSVFETYQDASLKKEWTASLKQACDAAGIAFFTSAYSLELVDYVDPFVPAFKIGSGDITWLDIISRIAGKGKPVLLATGAAELADVERAANAVLALTSDLVLLQCNTNYTASLENYSYLQLSVLRDYEVRYPGVILGLSDHMPGDVAVLGSVAMGAKVIEKHFTDSAEREGPDHPFSMTPSTWREMVERTRQLEASLGDGYKKIEMNERNTVILQRRCIRANCDLAVGARIVADAVAMLRPCPVDGIPPYKLDELLGRQLNRDMKMGEHITWGDVS